MLGIRSRKIFSDLFTRRTRTFLVSASIFVGVLGVIALFTTRDLITRQLEEDVRQDELSMIDIQVSVAEGVELDNGTYLETLNRENEVGRAIAALDGIERVEGQAFFPIDFRKPDSDDFTIIELRAYWTPLQEVQIEPMRLVAGEWPVAEQNQVAVEQRFADLHDFEIGDAIILRALGDEEGEQVEVTYTISGLVFHPYIFKGLTQEFPGPEEGIYAQFPDAQSLLKIEGFSKIIARYETFQAAQENYTGFQNALLEISPYVPVFPTFEDPADNAQIDNANIFNNVLTSLAFVTMVVSGFLVINVISTIVFEQKKQIGAMKTIGAGIGDNFFIYAGMALAYGVIGTAFAIIPGMIAGYLNTLFLAPQLDVLIEGFQWSPQAVLIGAALGLIVPTLSSMLPVYNGVRVRIIDSITDLGISGTYGEGRVERFLANLPFPISVRQAFSNVYQKRSRLLLTGFTLMLTVATFMATISLTIILNNELTALFDRLLYEFEITPNGLQNQAMMEEVILNVDGIESASPASLFFIQLEGDYENFFTRNNLLQVFGLDPEGEVSRLIYTEGTGWDEDPDRVGLVVSIAVADQLGLQVGDEVAFRVGGKRVTRELIGIERNGFDAGYLLWEDLAVLAGSVEGVPRPNEYLILTGFNGQLVPALGIDETLIAFIVEGADADTPGVLVSGDLAEAAEIEEGDVMTIQVAGEPVERRVDAVIANEVLQSTAEQFIPQQAGTIPGNIILFGFTDLATITGIETEGDPVPNAYYVSITQENPTASEVDEVIEALNTTLLSEGIPSRFINRVEFADNLSEVVVTNTSIIGAATLLIASVGAIGLLTTLSITVLERQKEIGVMRSIGADSTTIAIQFVIEGLIIGAIAWVVSIPVSFWLARALFGVFQLEFVPFTYPPVALVIGLIGILLVSAISSLGPALSAARKTVSEILRYQ